jgi:adenylate kinase
LNDNDCQNRGFVLDGFPRTYEDAKGVFYHTLAKKEKKKVEKAEGEGEEEQPPEEEVEEEEDGEKYKPKFQVHIYPDSVVLMRGTEAELKAKAKKLDPHILKGSHYTDGDMERRLYYYNEHNNIANYHIKGKSMPLA